MACCVQRSIGQCSKHSRTRWVLVLGVKFKDQYFRPCHAPLKKLNVTCTYLYLPTNVHALCKCEFLRVVTRYKYTIKCKKVKKLVI